MLENKEQCLCKGTLLSRCWIPVTRQRKILCRPYTAAVIPRVLSKVTSTVPSYITIITASAINVLLFSCPRKQVCPDRHGWCSWTTPPPRKISLLTATSLSTANSWWLSRVQMGWSHWRKYTRLQQESRSSTTISDIGYQRQNSDFLRQISTSGGPVSKVLLFPRQLLRYE